MTKRTDAIAKMLNRRTDLGKAHAIMGLAGVCGTAFRLNELLGEPAAVYGNAHMTRGDEAQARELVRTLIAGFGAVDADCVDSAVSMAGNALNNRTSPIAPQAAEFLRAEFLRIAQVAEGLAKEVCRND
ncbi:hypothetical protein EI613_24750 [Azospirillum sp. 412522]|nr:hypothetical protein [Azospirillum sp. 412522]MBY6265104.1 hypothetical protein [Azospirillum sp. 412522]